MNASHQTILADTVSAKSDFKPSVIAGLSAREKYVPSKFFYDQRGSNLFDQICELEEYYPTRIETEIMLRSAEEMADRMGPQIRLVEYGSGSSVKTRKLLDNLIDVRTYIPVDVSGDHVQQVADGLRSEYPSLEVVPIVADFTDDLMFPQPKFGTSRTCLYFPGSTIGNFEHQHAAQLLTKMFAICGCDGGLLIGFDLQKDIGILQKAYNDDAGVTAAFNKNLLHRINRELGGKFKLDQFTHRAFYDIEFDRIEMQLVSRCDQTVLVAGRVFSFRKDEAIRTEYSHKYSIDGFASLAANAGWNCRQVWTDWREYFAVMYLE